MVHYIYILRCADDALYVGETADLIARWNKHIEGSASAFTSKRRPLTLVYAEEHVSEAAAIKRERQLKRWTRAKKEALVSGDFPLLKRL